MSRGLSIASWLERRSYTARIYGAETLRERKTQSVTVILPCLNVGSTLGPILDVLSPFRANGLIDELVVVDSSSDDDTVAVARSHGVEVHIASRLRPEFGPSLGKGDALWRALSVTSGDIVVFFDTDTENFAEHFVLGMLGPMFDEPEIRLLKGAFHRPLQLAGVSVPDEGGRVTELVARSLINLYLPQLSGFVQPLAGEVAARRTLLERLSFPVGYGVEIAMLVDALQLEGIDSLAQVDLGMRKDACKSLRELSSMAYAVLATFMGRVPGAEQLQPSSGNGILLPTTEGLEERLVILDERPPGMEEDRSESVGRR